MLNPVDGGCEPADKITKRVTSCCRQHGVPANVRFLLATLSEAFLAIELGIFEVRDTVALVGIWNHGIGNCCTRHC